MNTLFGLSVSINDINLSNNKLIIDTNVVIDKDKLGKVGSLLSRTFTKDVSFEVPLPAGLSSEQVLLVEALIAHVAQVNVPNLLDPSQSSNSNLRLSLSELAEKIKQEFDISGDLGSSTVTLLLNDFIQQYPASYVLIGSEQKIASVGFYDLILGNLRLDVSDNASMSLSCETCSLVVNPAKKEVFFRSIPSILSFSPPSSLSFSPALVYSKEGGLDFSGLVLNVSKPDFSLSLPRVATFSSSDSTSLSYAFGGDEAGVLKLESFLVQFPKSETSVNGSFEIDLLGGKLLKMNIGEIDFTNAERLIGDIASSLHPAFEIAYIRPGGTPVSDRSYEHDSVDFKANLRLKSDIELLSGLMGDDGITIPHHAEQSTRIGF